MPRRIYIRPKIPKFKTELTLKNVKSLIPKGVFTSFSGEAVVNTDTPLKIYPELAKTFEGRTTDLATGKPIIKFTGRYLPRRRSSGEPPSFPTVEVTSISTIDPKTKRWNKKGGRRLSVGEIRHVMSAINKAYPATDFMEGISERPPAWFRRRVARHIVEKADKGLDPNPPRLVGLKASRDFKEQKFLPFFKYKGRLPKANLISIGKKTSTIENIVPKRSKVSRLRALRRTIHL